MYIALFVTLVGLGAWLVQRGRSRGRPVTCVAGVVLIAATALLIALMSFWVDMLWYDALGYGRRFWTFVISWLLAVAAGAAVGAGGGYLLSRAAGRQIASVVARLGAVAGVVWGMASWQQVLLFLYAADTQLSEPILGYTTGFYLFTLPLLDHVFWLALVVSAAALLAALLWREADGRVRFDPLGVAPPLLHPVPLASCAFAAVAAGGTLLRLFHVLYSDVGVVTGPGWTDVNVRVPAIAVMVVVLAIAGLLPLVRGFRALMSRLAARHVPIGPPDLVAVCGAWSAVGVIWITLIVALPALVQWLVVKPNEITFETPYIAHNIAFTRTGFKLDQVEEREFSANAALTRQSLRDNAGLLGEVRLWDWRALDAVYRQFQEIRLYYEFVDVDIDRYWLDGRYRQVMVSAREMAQQNLPEQSRTFVNLRFKYTHGYGYTLAPVSDFSSQGLPNLLVKDIPPVAAFPELELSRPEIYYGELTTGPAVVNTREAEFDYPSGETNMYTRYAGRGGVALSSLWRRFIYGWRFDGTVLLLSSYPTAESRVLYHREIRSRVQRVAPFLEFDDDPYIVAADGRLYWILDGYTSSSYFPYAQPFDSNEHIEARDGNRPGAGERQVHRLDGRNYVRNAVKAVVDAYDGRVHLYVFDPDDPIISTWQNILPDLFRPSDAMPASLRAHVRYPEDFLLVQGLIYASYHMADPEVFYNQEDLWVRATEKHYHDIAPVEPYYVMWQQPGSPAPEFVLMLPFTPKNRQVLIGWIAALSDGDNYGRFLAYKFPKERRVLGPQQVETKIDQDSFLSGQLTLWDQQGSEVIRGNVLAIPIQDSLLYVEPIYLRAETAAYPELRLVAVMHGDKLSYAQTLDEALLGLFDERDLPAWVPGTSTLDLAREAQGAFDAYLQALGAADFTAAADALTRLQQALQQLTAAPADAADG